MPILIISKLQIAFKENHGSGATVFGVTFPTIGFFRASLMLPPTVAESGSNNEKHNVSDWENYVSAVMVWKRSRAAIVGSFAEPARERCWSLCKEICLPDASCFPILILPLRIHLARGDELGCALDPETCRDQLLPIVNSYWEQAGIQWMLNDVVEKHWSDDGSIDMTALRTQIWSLNRDPATGMMADKDVRRKIFLENLLPDHHLRMDTYDVYFFDLVGQQSQGCCISEATHTVIMGRRSTKGYHTPTERPIECLGKTCAHELGHALGLKHPRGKCFSDGVTCTLQHGNDNLMTGGQDAKGGGGTKLESWQIVLARESAEQFLSINPPHL